MRAITAIVVAALLLAACGSGDGAARSQDVRPGEVAALADGSAVRVTGMLFIEQTTRLCEIALESYPPQCGGGSVVVNGLDPESVVGLSAPTDPTFAPVTWTDYPLTVLGSVRAGEVDVSAIDHQRSSGEAGGIVTRLMLVRVEAGIVFAMDVTNGTGDTVPATFADGQDAEVVIADADGSEVYRWSDGKAFTEAIRTIELPAGATRTAILHDEPIAIGDGWHIEGWFVADTLRDAVASGTLHAAG